LVSGETVLRDPNDVTGSQGNLPGFIHLKPSGPVQRKNRGFIILTLHQDAPVLVLSRHGDSLTTSETGNVLMKLDDHTGLIIAGIATFCLRPLQPFELKEHPFISAPLL